MSILTNDPEAMREKLVYHLEAIAESNKDRLEWWTHNNGIVTNFLVKSADAIKADVSALMKKYKDPAFAIAKLKDALGKNNVGFKLVISNEEFSGYGVRVNDSVSTECLKVFTNWYIAVDTECRYESHLYGIIYAANLASDYVDFFQEEFQKIREIIADIDAHINFPNGHISDTYCIDIRGLNMNDLRQRIEDASTEYQHNRANEGDYEWISIVKE